MLSTITLEDMEFRAGHGCYDMEKIVGNRFLVNLSITAQIGDAADRDDIGATVNYLEAYEIVKRQMAVTSNIIENVALRILDAIYERFDGVQHVKITVSKLAPPLGGKIRKVSVSLER